MKDNKSLLLALLAGGLIITWAYHLYDKTQYSNQAIKEVAVIDSSVVAKAVSDSLRDFFTHTLNQLSSEKLETDSANTALDEELQQKVNEIDTLKTEIGTILKRKTLTQSDILETQVKIDSLKKKLAELKNENQTLIQRDKNLDGIASRLNNEINLQQKDNTKINEERKGTTNVNAPVFIASLIKFAAFAQYSESETETTSQEAAKKFVVSFTVKNNLIAEKNAEIIVVVTDPAGKSINPEVWDAGSFETKYEGRKVYTTRIRFEYNKGETKRLNFTLQPENFARGTYKLSLYHNGVRIGESSWKLT